jgi:hypothetical protein
MKRSHQARKHRSLNDRTDDGGAGRRIELNSVVDPLA